MADNFIYDNVALPVAKTNRNPVTDATRQWSATDANAVFTALDDIRDVLAVEHANVLSYGAVGDGVADDTAFIQAALNATRGIPLYFPKGIYRVTSTLTIATTCHRLVGDYGTRNSAGGTELVFYGTGPCIQIGTDNLLDWDANLYDGPQDHIFENIAISHGAPDSSLASAPGLGSVYKANAYAIWDWRGGGIVLDHVRMERFEANFVGIQSDINLFQYVQSHYSKYGLYLGPRSDQWIINVLYSFLCDRSVTIDRAKGATIQNSHFVGCGHSTASPIEIRRGSSVPRVQNCWFEHLAGVGYLGTDQQSFVSVGEVDGYGSGGSIASAGPSPTTSSVSGCVIANPFVISDVAGQPAHTQYVATVGKCTGFRLIDPATQAGSSLTNFDSLVAIQAAQAPTGSDTQLDVCGTGLSSTLSKNFTNLGAGTPVWRVLTTNSAGPAIQWTSSGRYDFRSSTGSSGTDAFQLSAEGSAGNFYVISPNYAGGQTTRLRLSRSIQPGLSAAAPSSGTYERGDRVFNTDAVAGGYAGWYCTTGGTPGTWNEFGLITGNTNAMYAIPKAFALIGELVPAQITANQDNYSPSGLGIAYAMLINSSGAFNITGIASVQPGRELFVYNTGANNITLKHQDAASTATNRIIGRGNADVVLTPATGLTIWYSPSITRWLCKGDSL